MLTGLTDREGLMLLFSAICNLRLDIEHFVTTSIHLVLCKPRLDLFFPSPKKQFLEDT